MKLNFPDEGSIMKFTFYSLSLVVFLFILSCKKPGINAIATTTFSLYRKHALDVDWDHSGSNRIAYSMKGNDGYYDIHTADPDGSNDSCLTCALTPLTDKHIAVPSWHPSGNWLLMTVEKAVHPGSSFESLPGFGSYTDIWIMNRSATRTFRLLDAVNDKDHGVILPRFSHDGKHILWTDRKKRPGMLSPKRLAGFWTIKIADFEFRKPDSIPVISNIRTIEPMKNYFYEAYGFSNDDSRIIFCSNINRPSFFDENIYTIGIDGNNLVQLTNKDYNEHAMFSPDGKKIVWMTNAQATGGTDWWMMNADGTAKHRLTYFNEPANSQYAGSHVWCGLVSFSPDGNSFVGGRQISLITQEGEVVKVNLPQN
jgi:Tol biopolymer transport system component